MIVIFQILQAWGWATWKIAGKIHMIVKLVYGQKLKKKNG